MANQPADTQTETRSNGPKLAETQTETMSNGPKPAETQTDTLAQKSVMKHFLHFSTSKPSEINQARHQVVGIYF